MAYDLTEPLVIGISSRALFDLEKENAIFENEGLAAYEEYQVKNEREILPRGVAFPLVKAFLDLNRLQEKRLVEVIVMSRNSPNTSLRIFNSMREYGLDISRAALSGGGKIAPYLRAFHTDLFLSANTADVQEALAGGTAAGKILTESVSPAVTDEIRQIRIAFDGDAVLFDGEAEAVYRKDGLSAFATYEATNADVPLSKGPFANFLLTLAHIQSLFSDAETAPIRTALVTARSAPAHERAIKTLRGWNVHIDEAFFLGGVGKRNVLSAFGAHIFFDDQTMNITPAAEVVPAALVPYTDET